MQLEGAAAEGLLAAARDEQHARGRRELRRRRPGCSSAGSKPPSKRSAQARAKYCSMHQRASSVAGSSALDHDRGRQQEPLDLLHRRHEPGAPAARRAARASRRAQIVRQAVERRALGHARPWSAGRGARGGPPVRSPPPPGPRPPASAAACSRSPSPAPSRRRSSRTSAPSGPISQSMRASPSGRPRPRYRSSRAPTRSVTARLKLAHPRPPSTFSDFSRVSCQRRETWRAAILGGVSRLRGDTPGAPRAASPEWRAGRILDRLDALFEIGRAAGTNRPGFGPGEERAHELVAGWMREAGLEVTRDRGGNLVGRLAGSEPELPEVWSGSHLDTPPDGGRFDGALGVLSALDAAEAIARRRPRRAAASPSSPFVSRRARASAAACSAAARSAGSSTTTRAICATPTASRWPRRSRALGLGELPRAGWLDPPPACFVELHIEQGPTLAAAGAAARHRQLDRGHGGPGARVLGSPRAMPAPCRCRCAPMRSAPRRASSSTRMTSPARCPAPSRRSAG